MIGQIAKGKTAVFIDAANIFYSQRTLGWRIDYARLKAYLGEETRLEDLRFYTGRVGADEKQKRFLTKLSALGYVVRSKEVKRILVGHNAYEWKGNLDVELALDAFRTSDSFDTLALFSGDSDFAYLLDLLKEKGKRVVVVSTRGHVSRELLERAKFVALPRLRQEIEKIKRPDKPASEV